VTICRQLAVERTLAVVEFRSSVVLTCKVIFTFYLQVNFEFSNYCDFIWIFLGRSDQFPQDMANQSGTDNLPTARRGDNFGRGGIPQLSGAHVQGNI